MAKTLSTIQTFDNGMTLELDTSGWDNHYRLTKGGITTEWGMYENLLVLDGLVAVSPYYTEQHDWILVSPVEAINYIGVGPRTVE